MKLFRFFQILIFLIIVFIPLYLYFAYAYFYNYVGGVKLTSPIKENPQHLYNTNGEIKSIKYIALGDSLSAGTGSTNAKETFTYQFAQNLSKKYQKVEFYNVAWPGDTTTEVIKNQLPQAIAENPHYITLLIGTNDVHNKMNEEEFRKNYEFILQELLSKTNAQITVINIPYLGSNKIALPPYNWILNMRIKTFNKIISDQVDVWNVSKRINFVDLYNKTGGVTTPDLNYYSTVTNYYSTDQFHPSNAGYMFWARYINAN